MKEFCLNLQNGTYRVDKMITTSLDTQDKDSVIYPPLNKDKPYEPVITGKIEQTVLCDGVSRPFLIYIPQGFPVSGPGIFVFPDDGMTAQEYWETEGEKIADQFQVCLIILQARPCGWNRRDIQSEIDYAEAVFRKANSRNYVGLNESTYYTFGIGNGAYLSTAYTLLNSATFSVLLADGDYHLHPDLLTQLQSIPSDRDARLKKTDVPMTAWLADTTSNDSPAVLNTLLNACKAIDRGMYSNFSKIYQQNPATYQNTLNGLPIVEVQHTPYDLRQELKTFELHCQMLAFALRFKRWLCIGNGAYRPAANYKDMGLIRVEKRIGGRLREWYVYIPSAYYQDPFVKRPLVLGLHGYSNTGVMFAGSSDWHVVAENRNFFAVFPTAYPSGMIAENSVPLPSWNSTLNEPDLADCRFSDSDDVGFILQILKEMEENYPIDKERVYVTGHSNGSLLTHKLMDEIPQKFAAFGPQAAQYHFAMNGKRVNKILPEDGVIRPVWLIMGHEDVGDQDSLAPDSTNTRFLDMMCHTNHADRSRDYVLETGKMTTHTFTDANGVPLVKFTGISDMPHCYIPELAAMVWDEFFCHFRRKPDGSIEYIY